MKRDTVGPGAAAVHIVCADLLMSGYRATVAAEGLPYDIILDVAGKLYRIQVKSTRSVRGRPSRPTARPVYQFTTDRKHRPERNGPQSKPIAYTDNDIDLFACVALDLRMVAYFPVVGRFLTGIHLFPPDADDFVRSGVAQRRRISDFPISTAITCGEDGA